MMNVTILSNNFFTTTTIIVVVLVGFCVACTYLTTCFLVFSKEQNKFCIASSYISHVNLLC